ncbi:sce7726 family protein [Pseudomonas aeruginosa]
MKRSPKPARVLEELTIDNGNAIADVVACYREMHCYEIKGETDNVRRILSQSEFYSRSFPKLTLVTTENHVRWAMEKSLPIGASCSPHLVKIGQCCVTSARPAPIQCSPRKMPF